MQQRVTETTCRVDMTNIIYATTTLLNITTTSTTSTYHAKLKEEIKKLLSYHVTQREHISK